jgi:rubrerythrin
MNTSNPVPASAEDQQNRPKRTLNAQKVVSEIKGGMSDGALMSKYKISARGLQSLFTKLLDAHLIDNEDLEARTPWSDSTVDIKMYRCPGCGMPHFSPSDVCPVCGVMMSKSKSKKTAAGSTC